LLLHHLDGVPYVDTCIVDQNVQAARFFLRGSNCVNPALFARNIQGEEKGPAPLAFYVRRKAFPFMFFKVADKNRRPFFGKTAGDSLPQPLGRAGDESGFVREARYFLTSIWASFS
jgi:hypothetical protein